MKSIVLKNNKNKLGITNTDSKIFKLLKPDENTLLSNMSQNMEDYLFELLDDYHLEYRNTLNLKKSTTFGFEIEIEDANIEKIRNYLFKKKENWYLVFDPSLKNGAEIPTPILKDNKQTWNEIKKNMRIFKW